MFVSKTKSKLFWYDIKVSYRVYEMQYKYAVQVKCHTVQKCKKCSKNQILNVAHGTLEANLDRFRFMVGKVS